MNPQERADAHPYNPHVARAEADRMFAEAFVLESTPVLAADVARAVGQVLPVRHRRGDGSYVARFVRWVAGVMAVATGSVLAVGLMVTLGGA